MDQIDDLDVYGTFSPSEARRAGVMPLDEDSTIIGKVGVENKRLATDHNIGHIESEKNV